MANHVYTIKRAFAGAGRTVWRWTVQRPDDTAALAMGTSIKSEDAARADALAAIERLLKKVGDTNQSRSKDRAVRCGLNE
jgi:hypothetical protein